jgi:ATP-dependent HslUV protease ATP-binding subunit HslU
MGIDLSDTLGALTPEKKVQRTVTVKEAQELLVKEEQAKLVNEGDIYTAVTLDAFTRDFPGILL